jgi:uroporphyrin-III C-methyltransferase/precorrin-2 dehydrogenase/sirohydrochlorin ferrochelatase
MPPGLSPRQHTVHEPELFPVFLKLAGRPVLVVGGGVVASGKIDALRSAGADITVVAPAISQSIRNVPVRIVERAFVPSDLDGQWFVVAAATPEVNRAVAEHAFERRMFVNAVDDPANASAYLGGVLRRDGVTIAISTSGRAPAIAGLLREGLDALLPDDLDRWFSRADELKQTWRSAGVPMEARRPQLMEALIRLYEERQTIGRAPESGRS